MVTVLQKYLQKFGASCVLEYLLLTLLPIPLALGQCMLLHRPLCTLKFYVLVSTTLLCSWTAAYLHFSSASIASSQTRGEELEGGRPAALGGQARPRTRAVAADKDKAVLLPQYPFLSHDASTLT